MCSKEIKKAENKINRKEKKEERKLKKIKQSAENTKIKLKKWEFIQRRRWSRKKAGKKYGPRHNPIQLNFRLKGKRQNIKKKIYIKNFYCVSTKYLIYAVASFRLHNHYPNKTEQVPGMQVYRKFISYQSISLLLLNPLFTFIITQRKTFALV